MDFEKEIDVLMEKDKMQRRTSRMAKNSKEHDSNNAEFDRIQDRYFDVIKNLTILSGTVFASSVALATGKQVTNYFVFGEFTLFLATLAGTIYIWSMINSREIRYFYNLKWSMEGDLLVNKDIIDDFENEQIGKMIEDYDKLINKKSFLNYVWKIIRVDWLSTIFFITFTIGLFSIWLSLTMSTTPIQQTSTYSRRHQEIIKTICTH